MYAYAANNPVHYIDPDGRFVANFSNKYVLAKLEKEGFVIIPPNTIYDGRTIYEKGENKGSFFSPYQNGKIDGVFPTSNEGLIHKISDGNLNGIAGTLENFFVGSVNVMIIQTNKNDIFSFISDLGSLALNSLADLKKRMSDEDKDLSGYYKLGELWKDLVPSAPSQDILKKNCESKRNFFGIKGKVPTFISSDEVKQLFKPEQETK